MRLVKLDKTFYRDHSHLKEALDNQSGQWQAGKVRGYGIVVINVNDLTFAIPLRSHIKHSASYITDRSSQAGIKGAGLDFSKALLITDNSYISNLPFKISQEQHTKLLNKKHHITKKFDDYVLKYIGAVKKPDQNILGGSEYRFSTLVNYHSELGL